MSKSMDHASRISMEDYTYDLPGERIASHPLGRRDASRLLIYGQDGIRDGLFGDLARQLLPGTLLVMNNTRVVQARLEFFKDSGARIEVFCLHPVQPSADVQLALGSPSPCRWFCLVGNARKWKSGELKITNPDNAFTLGVRMVQAQDEGFLLDFSWEPAHYSFAEVLEACGRTPLPPYIRRPAETSDRQNYQCVYAMNEGSVAAPTAGLHFTPELLNELEDKGVHAAYLTLHVGAGTFKPVSSPTIGEHQMHREQFVVDKTLLEQVVQHAGPLVPVGTTSMRSLESLYWLGAKVYAGQLASNDKLYIDQWFPYGWSGPRPGRNEALRALLDWMDRHHMVRLKGETSLIIVPSYRFMMSDSLVTNFHQPGSTLLLLVAAFIGPAWKAVYGHALENNYRFLSYGDACFLDPGQGRKDR